MESRFGYLLGRSLRDFLVVVGGAVGLLAVLWIAPAYACGPGTYVAALPSSGPPGASVEVFGYFFEVETPITLLWEGEGEGEGERGTVLAETTTDDAGAFRVMVTVPDAEPGSYIILARQGGPDGTDAAMAYFGVEADLDPPVWPAPGELSAADSPRRTRSCRGPRPSMPAESQATGCPATGRRSPTSPARPWR